MLTLHPLDCFSLPSLPLSSQYMRFRMTPSKTRMFILWGLTVPLITYWGAKYTDVSSNSTSSSRGRALLAWLAGCPGLPTSIGSTSRKRRRHGNPDSSNRGILIDSFAPLTSLS